MTISGRFVHDFVVSFSSTCRKLCTVADIPSEKTQAARWRGRAEEEQAGEENQRWEKTMEIFSFLAASSEIVIEAKAGAWAKS